MHHTGLILPALFFAQSIPAILPPWPSKWEGLSDTFDWSSLEPQWKLRYVPCYGGLECAKYLVPLDWTHLSTEKWKEIAIGVARLPASVERSDPSFGGTIVLNPGGPSGSGVDFLRWSGRGIQEIVDGEKHFEILAFDPRGTKYSWPSSRCFGSDEGRESWLVQNKDVGSVDDSKLSLDVKWALSQGLGRLCDTTKLGGLPDGSSIRQYISTSQVAYDMVKLTDAIDEELKYTLASDSRADSSQHIISKRSRAPVLNYWGYSYGTYLGNTYASMFPGRIGRMIFDGVVDAPDYTATGWASNLHDNNQVWRLFFDWCIDAGPKCALYDDTMEKSADLEEKLAVFTDFLKDNPMPIVYAGQIYLLTHFDLQATMHFASYGPYQVWPSLAAGLESLMQGTAEAFVPLDQNTSTSAFFPFLLDYNLLDPFRSHSTPYPPGYPHGLEASTAILCGDGDDITSDTKDDYLSYLSELKNQSSLIGPVWAQITLSCRHWPRSQRPAERNRFTGPFTSKLKDYQQDDRVSPLLFIGNTADPVTPLRNAVKMAAGHEGATVLIQDAPGHCSGTTIPSNCTWNAIKDFFNYGKLPKNGTVCEVDWKPWDKLEV